MHYSIDVIHKICSKLHDRTSPSPCHYRLRRHRQLHLKAATALSNARVVALADLAEGRVKETAQKFNIPRWTTDTASLLADPEVDAVVLALPAHIRTALAIEAFRHSKHVLTEKLVAMNSREVEMMIEAQGDRVDAAPHTGCDASCAGASG